MKRTQFYNQNTKALRQLRFLSATLNQKAKQSQTNKDTLDTLKHKIGSLIHLLKSRVRYKMIRKVMGPAFVLFGLLGSQTAQAQNFSEPQELPKIPYDGVTIPQLIDTDNDGDLDILGLTFDYANDQLAIAFIENTGTAEEMDIDSIRLDFVNIDLQNLDIRSLTYAPGDIDNDGDIDFITVGYDYSSYEQTLVLYFENMGDFNFPQVDTLSIIEFDTENPLTFNNITSDLVDFDNDGDLDVLSIGVDIRKYLTNNYEYFGSVFFYENTGTADSISLINPVILDDFPCQPLEGLAFFDLADLDNDGDLDILQATYDYDTESTIELYYENNDGIFSTPLDLGIFPDDGQVTIPVTGDLDGDGDIDILYEAYFGSYITTTNFYWAENLGITSTRDFIDFDGQVTLQSNLVTTDLVLDVNLDKLTTLDMSIINPAGQQMYGDTRDIHSAQIQIDIQDLASGLYYIKVSADNRIESLSFYKN